MSTPHRPAEGRDPLADLSERLRSAQETADRLVREATEAAEGAAHATMAGGDPAGDRPPPRGFTRKMPAQKSAYRRTRQSHHGDRARPRRSQEDRLVLGHTRNAVHQLPCLMWWLAYASAIP